MDRSFVKEWAAALLLFACVPGAWSQRAAAPAFHFRLQQPHGPYTVGFRVVDQVDAARGYGGRYDELGHRRQMGGRPMQTLIWYPATSTAASSRTLTWGDYIALIAGEEGAPKDAAAAEKASGYLRSLTQASFADPMWGVRDAAPGTGRFPVVVYAPSFNASAFENADLCEYWASHGYVVLASPELGPQSHSMSADQAGVNAQAGDISFLVGYAATLPDADPGEIAVAGYSWGGISNLYAAARDSRIDALIMLDGSARYFPKLVHDSGDIKPDSLPIPLLYVSSLDASLEVMDKFPREAGPNVLNALTHADVTILRMQWMEHGDFSSSSQRRGSGGWTRPPFIPPPPGTPEDAAASYAWVARYSLAFLDATLKHEEPAKTFLAHTPAENGVPAHMMLVEHRPAAGVPPTMDALRGEVGRLGFDHIDDIYRSMQAQTPDFKVDEQAINTWGYQLVRDGYGPQSIAVMRFNTVQFPKSSNTWDALGEAYRNAGNMPEAIQAYRQALVVDPNNQAVKDKLKQYAPAQ